MSGKAGFTLIEILIVIAIIGLLSGIVVVFLSGARGRGYDVAIKSSLKEIRNLAEIYYSENGQYVSIPCGVSGITPGIAGALRSCILSTVSTYCRHSSVTPFSVFKDVNVLARAREACNASGGSNCDTSGGSTDNTFCKASNNDWAVAVKLRSDSSQWWCVDSSGANIQTSGSNADNGGSGSLTPINRINSGPATCQ
ncbi:prepilin-type N-terminal cleavage/methylation domain-containing protein [Candidatus Nomurabacteria bacterium]|nr:prepilin-type N-terminal cleavage/methylation domain-containing protein [Candidatus Nomurabacteria bacterium]